MFVNIKYLKINCHGNKLHIITYYKMINGWTYHQHFTPLLQTQFLIVDDTV